MKTSYWIIALLAVLIVGAWLLWPESTEDSHIFAEVQEGPFEVSVQTTGELRAKDSEEIHAPSGLRGVGIYRVEISDLVAEGTVVEEGDYIATLDRSELSSKIEDHKNELQQEESRLRQVQLDTMLTLRGLRNDMEDLKHSVEEREIEVEHSQYEPPATQRQAKIDLERAERELQRARENYEIRQEQAEAEVYEVETNIRQLERELEDLEEMLEKFEVKAPSSGMVIYQQDRNGDRREVGSTVTPWNPVVATLPDLDTMMSRTYVNEIDISQVNTGQPVRVGIDAFPDKELEGEVSSVANVGEELDRADARVFQVEVMITERDTSLRPAMTSSNHIITESYDNKRYIPLEGLHKNDTMEYAIVNRGNSVLQEIRTGASNENHVIVEEGLEREDEVFLTIPGDHEELPVKSLEEE